MKRSNEFLFAAALDLVRERSGQSIVELGSIRSAGAQKSDGHSTGIRITASCSGSVVLGSRQTPLYPIFSSNPVKWPMNNQTRKSANWTGRRKLPCAIAQFRESGICAEMFYSL